MQDITNGRCGWCGTDELYVKYHDEEWGVPVHDDRKHFEMLTLEGAQQGTFTSTNLTPTTPLPYEASGLIVFTQDFRIARKLNDDADRVEQECLVQVDARRALQGPLDEDVIYQAIDRLCHGLSFNGIPLPPIKVSIAQQTDKELWLRFAFKGIRPGQIPQMVERVGLRLLAIKRIRIGHVQLGQLPAGQWRYLGAHERF